MWLSRNKEHKDAQDQGAAELQAIRQSMAMIEFTPDGIILDANPAFLGVVNYRLEEIVGKHHRLFCSRNLSESLAYQQFWQRLRQGEHFSDRFPRLTQDGKEVWLEATYMPIRDDHGSVTKVMKIATDITRQVAAEHMHESYIKAIDRSMAVIEFNLEGEVVSANQNFLDLMGYRRDDVIGQHHRLFCLAEDSRSDDYRQFWARLNKGEFMSDRFRRVTKQGQQVWLRATYNPLYDANGRVYGV